MAKRRTKKQDTSGFMALLTLAGVIFAAAMIVTAVREAEQHPITAGVVVFLIATGAGLYGVYWWRQREQKQVYARQQYGLKVARSREIAPYHQMGPKEFERALAFLCERDGCTDVQVVGGAGDLGADVIATTPDGRRIVIQAKRYQRHRTVGSQAVQVVNGTYRDEHGGHLAAIVTTATFTKPAREYANRVGIRCFDEQALAAWASRTGPSPWQ